MKVYEDHDGHQVIFMSFKTKPFYCIVHSWRAVRAGITLVTSSCSPLRRSDLRLVASLFKTAAPQILWRFRASVWLSSSGEKKRFEETQSLIPFRGGRKPTSSKKYAENFLIKATGAKMAALKHLDRRAGSDCCGFIHSVYHADDSEEQTRIVWRREKKSAEVQREQREMKLASLWTSLTSCNLKYWFDPASFVTTVTDLMARRKKCAAPQVYGYLSSRSNMPQNKLLIKLYIHLKSLLYNTYLTRFIHLLNTN